MNNLGCDIRIENPELVNNAHDQALFNPFSLKNPNFCFKNFNSSFITCFKTKVTAELDSVEDQKTLIDLTLDALNSGKTFFISHENAQRAKAFYPVWSRSSNEIENLEEPELVIDITPRPIGIKIMFKRDILGNLVELPRLGTHKGIGKRK